MITSCSGSRQYDFKSSEDALKQYQAFFQTMKGHSDSDAEHLADFINQWHEYGDTVLNYIRKDPSFNAHSGLSMKYDLISDSIRTELLGMTGNCTLSDVAYVKLHTSLYKDNKELGSLKENAIKFFATMMIFLFVRQPGDYYMVPLFTAIGNVGAIVFVYWHLFRKVGVRFCKVTWYEVWVELKESSQFFLSKVAGSINQLKRHFAGHYGGPHGHGPVHQRRQDYRRGPQRHVPHCG